jgi:hypothetical protein
MIRALAIFSSIFVLTTVAFALCWGVFVADHLYNCTDSMPSAYDYFTPGNWVHSWKPIQFVPEVHIGRPMSEPDVIKSGWSISSLWCLWLAMVVASLAFSLSTAQHSASSAVKRKIMVDTNTLSILL